MHCFSSSAGTGPRRPESGVLPVHVRSRLPKVRTWRDIRSPQPRSTYPCGKPIGALSGTQKPFAGAKTQRTRLYPPHQHKTGPRFSASPCPIFAAATQAIRQAFHQGARYQQAAADGRDALTILGCGSSAGVRALGRAFAGDCDPAQFRRNNRRRCSLLIETRRGRTALPRVLIDTSPDLRAHGYWITGVGSLTRLSYTHKHIAIHVHAGLDDAADDRLSTMRRRHARLGRWADTKNDLYSRFAMRSCSPPDSPYPPILDMFTINGPFNRWTARAAILP